jgi:hypothetical protein
MPFYNLLVIDRQQKTLATPAANREDALMQFGKELGLTLTFQGDGAPPFLLDEWEHGPHWVNPTIPVFKAG